MLSVVAVMASQGLAVAADPNVPTMHQLEEKAKTGDADAQYSLGVRYHVGWNVPQDYQKAQYYLELAAKQGNDKAANSLCVLSSMGYGATKDSTKTQR